MSEKLLSIEDLSIHYFTDNREVCAVNHVNLALDKGETLGLVGETGAGKTTIALGIMRLIPNPPGRILNGRIILDGENLLEKRIAEMQKIRGAKVSMIFQDPMTALNPIDSVGDQIAECIRLHSHISRAEAAVKAAETLELVGIPRERYGEYPHQFSGGMKQRIVIAIALSCNPELLIADEPTTALDVTIQAQVLEIMNELKAKLNMSMLLITHDLGVVAEMCDKVAIIYAGEIVESGSLVHIFDETRHPYTIGLFGSLPSVADKKRRLTPVMGLTPDPANLPPGCKFAPRCPYMTPECGADVVPLKEISPGHMVRCRNLDAVEGRR